MYTVPQFSSFGPSNSVKLLQIKGKSEGIISYPLRGKTGLILGLRSANERRRYFVTTSLIDWVQAYNQLCKTNL